MALQPCELNLGPYIEKKVGHNPKVLIKLALISQY